MNILLTTDYSQWSNDNTYIVHIIREQRFLKHLLFGMMLHFLNTNKKVVLNQHILVYIHAGFGDRKAKDYQFWPPASKEYKALIQTDDWTDRGTVQEHLKFFSQNEF